MSTKPINAVQYIPVDQIEPNPNQHRNVPSEERMWELLEQVEELLEDQYSENLDLTGGQELASDVIHLAESIDSQGLLQAIRVTPGDEKPYQIVYGEMRWWAHRWAGKDEIAAQIVNLSEADQRIQSVLENIHRRDTDALEKGSAAYNLFMAEGITENPDIIANLIKAIRSAGEPDWDRYHVRPTVGREVCDTVCGTMGRSPRTIERWLRATSVAPQVQDRIIEEQYDIADSILARISRIDSEEVQFQTLEKVIEQNLNVDQASRLVTWITDMEAEGDGDKARERLTPGRYIHVDNLDGPNQQKTSRSFGNGSNDPGDYNWLDPNLPSDNDGESEPQGNGEEPLETDSEDEVDPDDTDEVLYVPDLYNEAAESLLARIPDNSVQCVITDPPYGGDFEAHWPGSEDYTEHETWNGLENLRGIPEELGRVLQSNSYVFVFCVGQNLCETKTIFEEVFEFDHLLTWVKDIHNVGGGYWNRKKEQILAFEYGVGDLHGDSHLDVLDIGRGEEYGDQRDNYPNRIHQNQKPRRLFEELIEPSTKPGDVVLDPFGGSYAVARAAMVTERRGISCEVRADIHDKATELMAKQLQEERSEGFGKIKEDLDIIHQELITEEQGV